MKEILCKSNTDKSKEEIWELFDNPLNWKKWDKSISDIKYDKEHLIEGDDVTMTLSNGKKVKITISKVTKYKEYIVYNKLGPVTIIFDHQIIDKVDYNEIAIKVTVDVKLLKFLETKICNSLYNDLKPSVESLANEKF